ncbi:MAG: hypothetical protein JWN08_218 [Frankiales bacterium]|nr:hypothetical protein [Frankiales bacterium]
MHPSAGELLGDAVDAFAGLDGRSVAELQQLTGALVPQLERLAGVTARLVGVLGVRSGGTVPSVPLPDDSAAADLADPAADPTAGPAAGAGGLSVPGPDVPGPKVPVQHWLRDLGARVVWRLVAMSGRRGCCGNCRWCTPRCWSAGCRWRKRWC